MQSPGFRSSQSGSRPGVWGVGDHYGVYGASNKLYDDLVDNTPNVSIDAAKGYQPNDSLATGAIGCSSGASLNSAGALGVSDLVNDASHLPKESHFVGVNMLVQELAARPAGVTGISGSVAGVMGINVSGTGPVASISQQLARQLSAEPPSTSVSVSNTGVLGWSAAGRGGVFGSAQPLMDGVRSPENDQGSAQIRLLPLPVSLFRAEVGQAEVGPTPSLPRLERSRRSHRRGYTGASRRSSAANNRFSGFASHPARTSKRRSGRKFNWGSPWQAITNILARRQQNGRD